MHKMKMRIGLIAGLFLGFAALDVQAHGDVTPHPVDTSSLPPLGKDWILPNPYRGSEKAVAVGAIGYLHNCAGCHGLNAESGGVAPDLLPIMWGTGTGSEVMSRIAAPMVGGMVSSTVLTLAVIPAIYALIKQHQLGD